MSVDLLGKCSKPNICDDIKADLENVTMLSENLSPLSHYFCAILVAFFPVNRSSAHPRVIINCGGHPKSSSTFPFFNGLIKATDGAVVAPCVQCF